MRRLLREPLVQFLIGGAGLFLLYGSTVTDPDARMDRIVVSEAQIEALSAMFERTWMRPPQPIELTNLIADFVDEEILYREALALGLDQDDLVIRRRLRQKMEFLNADLVELPEPTDEDLAAYLASHPDRFAEPARVTFEHVFVNPDAGETAARQRANLALEGLRAGEAPAGLGDPTLLPATLEMADPYEIDSVFGTGFAADLLEVPTEAWTGPIASSYGLHLVRITDRTPLEMRELAAVRKVVERDWRAEQRFRANARALDNLRERYDVEIQLPRADPALTSSAP